MEVSSCGPGEVEGGQWAAEGRERGSVERRSVEGGRFSRSDALTLHALTLKRAKTACVGMGSPAAAQAQAGFGAVSGGTTAWETGQALGTRTLVTLGSSIQPSICWRVRTKSTSPRIGSP